MIDVTPDFPGDIVVRAGPESEDEFIRVHKSFLMTISPVFRAMLGAIYSEGQRKLDEDDPLVLPEDGHDDFLAFAKPLHFQPQELRASQIVGVAVLADKYRCARQSLQGLLSPLRLVFGPDCSIVECGLEEMNMTVPDAIYLATLAEDEDLLYRATLYAITQLPRREHRPDPRLAVITWIDLSSFINKAQEEQLEPLARGMQGYIRKLVAAKDPGGVQPFPCDVARHIVGDYYMRRFQLTHRLESSLRHSNKSLETIWRTLSSIADSARSHASSCCADDPKWHALQVQLLRDVVCRSRAEVKGLCLKCLWKGEWPHDDEECQDAMGIRARTEE